MTFPRANQLSCYLVKLFLSAFLDADDISEDVISMLVFVLLWIPQGYIKDALEIDLVSSLLKNIALN